MIPCRMAYFKAYYAANKPRIRKVALSWRAKNAARVKAHDRLRWLRSKAELSEGEMAQCAEIVRTYPKRRFVYAS